VFIARWALGVVLKCNRVDAIGSLETPRMILPLMTLKIALNGGWPNAPHLHVGTASRKASLSAAGLWWLVRRI
jgi:hypothetical protein